MLRTRPLVAAVLCTAALAACSDSTTATDRGSDALVNATNRNLGSEVVFEATQSETVTPGVAGLAPSGICYDEPYPVYSTQGTGGEGVNALPCRYPDDPYYPEDPYYPPPPPVTQPSFSTPSVGITGSSYAGTKTVNLNASGSFSYASFGQLTAIYKNVGGCSSTPMEYSRSTVTGENAPFTLSSSRSASYTGTTTYIRWGLSATSYAESPEGGSNTLSNSTVYCY